MKVNPFDYPDAMVDFDQFLENPIEDIERMFKDFFMKQVNNELAQTNELINQVKLYRAVRYSSSSNDCEYVFIKARTQSQAVYLFLLHETCNDDNYLFAEVLTMVKSLGLMSPVEVLNYIIQQMFNTDIPYSDYLIEVKSLSIIG